MPKYIKIVCSDDESFILSKKDFADFISDEVDALSEVEYLTIKAVEMSEEEFDNLPES